MYAGLDIGDVCKIMHSLFQTLLMWDVALVYGVNCVCLLSPSPLYS